jgi:hypothetical protein
MSSQFFMQAQKDAFFPFFKSFLLPDFEENHRNLAWMAKKLKLEVAVDLTLPSIEVPDFCDGIFLLDRSS